MTSSTTLTVLIPWANRPELAATLRANTPRFRACHAALGIINCGGDMARLQALLASQQLDPFVVDASSVPFNRSLALNLGAACSSSRFLFMLDADVLLDEQTLPQILSIVSDDSAVTIADRQESAIAPRSAASNGAYLRDVIRTGFYEFVWHDGRRTKVLGHRAHLGGRRAGTGMIAVSRANFERVGGYNSGLIGWGIEDIDLLARLQYVCGLRHDEIGSAVHLSHGDEMRDSSGGAIDESHVTNFRTMCHNYQRGRVAGTLTEDTAAYAHVLAPLQSRA
jgi:hypothetical protein